MKQTLSTHEIAKITEHGNGLPSLNEMVYDVITDSVYRIVAWDGSQHGSIRTNGPGRGNSVAVLMEYVGSASDLDEDEWASIESNTYGVSVAPARAGRDK